MPLAIEIAIAKTNKYASRESGDSAEIVERPGGGLSVVVVDGQGSGAAAKSLSMSLSSKAVALLKDGVRDGAVARAVHDSLIAFRHGKVSASFDIISVDLRTKTIVATRNASSPMAVRTGNEARAVATRSGPIGLYHFTRPAVDQWPLAAGTELVVYTDGIASAGDRMASAPFNVAAFLGDAVPAGLTAAALADRVLMESILRDNRRPADDMTVVALTVGHTAEEPVIRRQAVRMPLP